MTNPAPSTTKVCIRCGLDCSSRPRTKDTQGRYTCRDCFEAAQNEQAIVLPPAPKRSEHRIEPAAPRAGEDGDDNGIYALLLDDAVQAAAKVATTPCPGCGQPLKLDAAICVHCGFNARTGQVVTTKKAVVEAGYSPDEDPLVTARRRERRRQNAVAAQMEYIKPAVLLVVGLVLTCTLLNNRGADPADLAGYLIVYSISLPFAIGGFLFCCMLWLGFDSPLGLTALRLAAIYAMMDIVVVGMNLGIPGIGGLGFRFLLPLMISVALMMYLMEMEYDDALMAGVLTGVIKLVGTLMLIMWFINAQSD